jgi:hypothetical protein
MVVVGSERGIPTLLGSVYEGERDNINAKKQAATSNC